MSVIQTAPESSSPPPNFETSPTPRWIIAAFVILFAACGYFAYAGYSARNKLESDLNKSDDQAKVLSAQIDQANERIAQLKGKLEVTTQKLGFTQAELARAHSLAQDIRKQQQEDDAKLTAQIGQVKSESDAKIGQVSSDLGGAKNDIDATKKDLEATKGKLTTAVGDLNGQGVLIARNQDELEQLKRLGERNIFEFTASTKSKGPQRVGPIQVHLRKVDPKHYRYTMDVYADDKVIEKRDKTADEPVQFAVRGARAPYEIIVFEVGKDNAKGYLSTPKDVAASAAPSAPAKQ